MRTLWLWLTLGLWLAGESVAWGQDLLPGHGTYLLTLVPRAPGPGSSFRVCDQTAPRYLSGETKAGWQPAWPDHWHLVPGQAGQALWRVTSQERNACTGLLVNGQWYPALDWRDGILRGYLSDKMDVGLVRIHKPSSRLGLPVRFGLGDDLARAVLLGMAGTLGLPWPPGLPYPGGASKQVSTVFIGALLALLLETFTSSSPTWVQTPVLWVDVAGEETPVPLYQDDLAWLMQTLADDDFGTQLATYLGRRLWLQAGEQEAPRQRRYRALWRVRAWLSHLPMGALWLAGLEDGIWQQPGDKRTGGGHPGTAETDSSAPAAAPLPQEGSVTTEHRGSPGLLRGSGDGTPPPFELSLEDSDSQVLGDGLPTLDQFTRLCRRNDHEHLRQWLEASVPEQVQRWVGRPFLNPQRSLPLHIAVHYGSREIVDQLLDWGACTSEPDQQGVVPLYLAVQLNQTAIVAQLLERGADPDLGIVDSQSQLHLAALRGHEAMAHLTSSWSPLHQAARQGHGETVRILLASDRLSLGNVSRDNRLTALHVAARYGHEDVIRQLLARGMDVNAQANDGQTALYMASRFNQAGVVSILLAHGANPQLARHDGMTPLRKAMELGYRETSRRLYTPDIQQFIGLCQQDRLEQLQQWLHHLGLHERRLWVNTPLDGQYPVSLAVQYGAGRTLAWLLGQDADPNAAGADGEPPLLLAARNQDPELVGTLLRYRARVNQTGQDGVTALHLAALNGHRLIVEKLLARGANWRLAQSNGATPLHLAALNGHATVMELLLARGAKPNMPFSALKMTALHLAVKSGNPEAVGVLLARGADANLARQDGWNAFHLAAEMSQVILLDRLLAGGGKVNGRNRKNGATALHLAVQNGREGAARWLLERGADRRIPMKGGQTPQQLAINQPYMAALFR